MDHISVFEVVLAIIGTIIAGLQFLGEIRIRREEKKEQKKREEEKRTIGMILDTTKQADEMVGALKGFKENIDKLSHTTGNNPNDTVQLFDKAIDGYEADFEIIRPVLKKLYFELIRNEERFPMAYGYGRYIHELRDLLNFDELKRTRRNSGYDATRIEFHYVMLNCLQNKGGKVDDEDAAKLGALAEKMVHLMEPYFRHAESISSLLEELKTKYEDRNV